MLSLPVALQVYSVRDAAQSDFQGTMQKIKDMGYQGVELAGLYGLPADEIHRILDIVGLAAISAHVPITELIDDPEGTIAQYMTIGCKYIAIPYLSDEMRPGAPGFGQVIEKIHLIAHQCAKHGIGLLYHNHDFEFVRMPDGSYGLDYLYQAVPADLLQTELDTCWINVAGESPVAYIEKYAGRCPLVHFKDFYRTSKKRSGQLYELIGQAKKADRGQDFEFRPVGHGLQDVPALLKATIASGAAWIVVEQDQSVGRTPLEAAEMSIRYLRSL
ncbi:MAG: sugar phosphate isomerase/epimerase [Clostridiaceae bacterium]|nr:sugar phosphate isomerase/epimerase [Clostridiaceae bacterium]